MNPISHAIGVLTAPAPTVNKAAGEPATTTGLITGYAAPLAALPAVAALIIGLIQSSRYGVGSGVVTLILMVVALYVLRNLGTAVLVGFGLSRLAPNFGGRRDDVNGLKLAVLAGTPIWIAGLIVVLLGWLVPTLGNLLQIILLLGFAFAGYIFYLGANPMLGVTKEQAPIVAGIGTIAWLVLYYLIAEIVARIFLGYGGFGMMI